MATTNWDAPARLTFGVSDQTIMVRHPSGLQTINVPGGMTPREFAATIHAHDGYLVMGGFGYGPMEIHPDDCAICDLAVNAPHWYMGEDY